LIFLKRRNIIKKQTTTWKPWIHFELFTTTNYSTRVIGSVSVTQGFFQTTMGYTCSCCGMLGHNKRTCPVVSDVSVCKPTDQIPRAEKRAAKKLAALLPPPNKAKKSPKVIEGLEGCQNIWKIPASYYKAKKSPKVIEGLEGCQNIWKIPASYYKAKKSPKVIEGLEGCQNIWKVPASYYKAKKSPKVIEGLEGMEGCQNIWKVPASYYKAKKGTTKCSVCGEFGHNSRFHKSLKCSPCTQPRIECAILDGAAPPTLNIGVSNEDPFGVLEEIKKVSFTGFDGDATSPFPRRSSRIASMAY
jgi:hypothetical protein